MRRRAIRLTALLAGVAASVATAPTLSAWVDTTSNPSGTLSAIPDWVAPAVERVVAQKKEGGVSGYVRPGGDYHVCSRIAADTGNPASGLKDVVVDVTSLTTGLVNQVLGLLGGTSPCAGTDNRDSGLLTVAASTVAGSTTISTTARDNANNAGTQTAPVIVDGTAPTAVSFETANKAGGTAGRPETGDTMTFTFSEPVDPHSIIAGWDGTGTRPIYAYFADQGGKKTDRLMLFDGASQLVPLVATAGTNWIDTKQDSVSASFYFTSTIAASGNTFVITFGAPNVAGAVKPADLTASAATWPTSGTPYDRAGNRLGASTITQTETTKPEF